jgi:hypothetical protein
MASENQDPYHEGQDVLSAAAGQVLSSISKCTTAFQQAAGFPSTSLGLNSDTEPYAGAAAAHLLPHQLE